MWIALGIVGVLWFVGEVIVPDKNAPATAHQPPAAVSQAPAAPTPPAR